MVDEFANEIVGIFQNSFIRVEGNTDSTGNKKSNVELSKKRAEAVVESAIAALVDESLLIKVEN